VFYNDSYGRDIPALLSKNNADVSVYGEVTPSVKITDVMKI
jgi:hypothetical protein